MRAGFPLGFDRVRPREPLLASLTRGAEGLSLPAGRMDVRAPGRIAVGRRFSHGYLLAPEIADAFEAIKMFDTHQTQRDWESFRLPRGRRCLAPHPMLKYQQEWQAWRTSEGARRRSRRVRHCGAQCL